MSGALGYREAILWALVSAISLAAVIGLWHLASLAVDRPYLPSPLSVSRRLADLLVGGELLLHVGVTLLRLSIALTVATLAAVASGILAVRTRAGRPLRIIIAVLIPIPMMALMPLFLLAFGLEAAKVALVAASLYPILSVGVAEAASRIPREYEDILVSMGAGFMQVVRLVVIPWILMPLMTSLRICVGVSLSLTFVVESIAVAQRGIGMYGVGVLIESAYRVYDFEGVYAGIAVLSLTGFTIYSLLWVAEVRYRRARRL